MIFAMGESSEIGLKEVPEHGYLFGFGIEMIFASFQIFGMTFVFIDGLKR